MASNMRMASRLGAIGLFTTGLASAIVLASQSQPQFGEATTSASPIVASVGNQAITLHELEESAALPLYQVDRQRYQLLQQALQRRIENILLEREATKSGMTVAQLLAKSAQSETIMKLADIPAPVRRLAASGSTGEPEQDLMQDLRKEARIRQALLVSLRRKTDVRMTLPTLEPPIIPVSKGNDPSVGPIDAPISIVEFSDFQCPYCQKSVGVLKVLQRLYGEKIRIVYRDYPGPNHSDAWPAAEAAQCAGEAGKFWEYHDLLFDRQTLGRGWDFLALAKEVGLPEKAFSSCLNSGRHRQAIIDDLQEGFQLGISSTPTFFINGRPMVGAQTVSDFQAVIDPLLDETAKQDRARS